MGAANDGSIVEHDTFVEVRNICVSHNFQYSLVFWQVSITAFM